MTTENESTIEHAREIVRILRCNGVYSIVEYSCGIPLAVFRREGRGFVISKNDNWYKVSRCIGPGFPPSAKLLGQTSTFNSLNSLIVYLKKLSEV